MKRGRLILCVTAIFAALYWAFLIPYTVAELREGKSVQRGAALQRTDGISRILQDQYGRIFRENGFSDRTDYFRARMVAGSGDSYTRYEEYQPYAAALLDAYGVGDVPIGELDLTPGLIERARAERGDAPLA